MLSHISNLKLFFKERSSKIRVVRVVIIDNSVNDIQIDSVALFQLNCRMESHGEISIRRRVTYSNSFIAVSNKTDTGLFHTFDSSKHEFVDSILWGREDSGFQIHSVSQVQYFDVEWNWSFHSWKWISFPDIKVDWGMFDVDESNSCFYFVNKAMITAWIDLNATKK